jgi:glutamate-ammonia-ligase adenylyltransferase
VSDASPTTLEALRTEVASCNSAAAALAGLEEAAWARLARLADASPLYRRSLARHPAWAVWVETAGVRDRDWRGRDLRRDWQTVVEALPAGSGVAERLNALRTFRRRHSLRIAHREVNALAAPETTVRELSLLADLCVQECLAVARTHWHGRLGEPWDDDLDRPSRFCVLAFGKLGGNELNFSSDIDLLYVYEGEGQGRRSGKPAAAASVEIHTRVAEALTQHLQQTTADGFLFRTDLRLRPEGDFGPLVRSFSSLENYYAIAGQTWERLALIKARPIAGDLALGHELLESLHPFRYPRNPPPSVLKEIAAMKSRTEKEVVGTEALARNIKSGYGGIREIEFMVQSLQLLNAGRFPFLQTASTVEALAQLVRYELMDEAQARFLTEAYWYLRAVEHRVQMREERQTHELPVDDPAEMDAIARSLGEAGRAPFEEKLGALRDRVHAAFTAWFAGADDQDEFNSWWSFLTAGKADETVAPKLIAWFRGEPEAASQLQLFARGNLSHPVNRELVVRFLDLARSFDETMPRLARPMETLRRLARFAETYGTRQQFFNACALNPQLFRVLALLFDRSTFIFDVLRVHPEIFEEVLRPEILRQRKEPADLAREIAAGGEVADFADWLWHYVKAEQIRLAIGELVGFTPAEEVEKSLSALADAVLEEALRRCDPEGSLTLVALGKYGGGELTFGSDLDLVFLTACPDWHAEESKVRALQRLLAHRGPFGGIFEVDLRLRPHGDAGPLVATLETLAAYHRGGGAQAWERQLLTRARVAGGDRPLGEAFERWRTALLFAAPPSPTEEEALWAMRRRVERERDAVEPPQRAFKTGAGGLIDFEFAAQMLQLRHGSAHPELRSASTRHVLEALPEAGLVPAREAEQLRRNYAFLKRIEVNLRREASKPVSVIGDGPAQEALALWLGYPNREAFWADHCRRLVENRAVVLRWLGRTE